MTQDWPEILAENQSGFPKRLAEAVLSVIFPPHCLLCKAFAPRLDLHSVCLPCWTTLPRLQEPWCTRCGLPLQSSAAYAGIAAALCGECLRQPPAYAAARACGRYEGGLRELVHHLKFGGKRDLAYPLGKWMGHVLGGLPELNRHSIVIPVPLHPERQRKRGFNQACWLARQFCDGTSRILEPRALVRSKNTPPQSGLTDAQRRENIRGAFQVRADGKVRDRHILLVDDVFTTGSTLEACCRSLLDAGAASIGIFTLARVSRVT
jgi:ComF family protein